MSLEIDKWASIPFDSIGTFLVFLIGIPALVIQSTDPEVRRVAFRSGWQSLREGILFVGLALGVIVVGLLARPLWGANDWLWVIVLVTLFSTDLITAIYVSRRYSNRVLVIRDLEREVAHRLKQEPRLNEKPLQALVELGEQSTPGEDKQLVLQALYELTDRTCSHPQYCGDALEDLIPRLVDILASDSQPGNAKNFHTAADILQRVVISADTIAELKPVDLNFAIHALSSVSRTALTHIGLTIEVENTVMSCVQSLKVAARAYPAATTDVSQALYEIGAMALESKQPLVATAALDRLITLVQAKPPARGELVADLLGLAAHFWIAGPALCEYVADKLREIETYLELPLLQALEGAQRHCVKTNQFDTADDLTRMMAELQDPTGSYTPSTRNVSA